MSGVLHPAPWQHYVGRQTASRWLVRYFQLMNNHSNNNCSPIFFFDDFYFYVSHSVLFHCGTVPLRRLPWPDYSKNLRQSNGSKSHSIRPSYYTTFPHNKTVIKALKQSFWLSYRCLECCDDGYSSTPKNQSGKAQGAPRQGPRKGIQQD